MSLKGYDTIRAVRFSYIFIYVFNMFSTCSHAPLLYEGHERLKEPRYGPQAADFSARIVNRVIRQMEKRRREKAAKRALREGGRDTEEQGTGYYMEIIWK